MRENPNWLERFISLDPVLLRGVIVSFFALLGAVGIAVTDGLAESVLGFIVALAGLLTALLARPAVTPNDKVLAYTPDPYQRVPAVKSGNAVVSANQASEVVAAATTQKEAA